VLVVVRPHPAARLLEEGTILEGVANGGPIPILPPNRHPSRHLVKEKKYNVSEITEEMKDGKQHETIGLIGNSINL